MASLTKTYSKEKLQGQIYTPDFIVRKILDDVGYRGEALLGKSILDPACGDGRFLCEIAKRIIRLSPKEKLKENLQKIHGWDIDPQALQQAKDNLNALFAGYNFLIDWNLSLQNALQQGERGLFADKPQLFDFIVANPPYIRVQHLAKAEREYIQRKFAFCKSGSTDIYIAFFEIAYNLLKTSGIAGFITPNTFFSTETARLMRHSFAERQNICQITNYGDIQLFENATTYSAITVFGKAQNADFLFQQAHTKTTFAERKIAFAEIQNATFWQLSSQKQNLKKGIKLKEICNIHVGITTLSDKLYLFDFQSIEGDYINLNSKFGEQKKFEKAIFKPIIKASKLKSGNDKITEYVLFPYEKVKGKQQIISEQKLRENYPLAYAYLLSVKTELAKRDNGSANPVAWYAFGRTQSLNTGFGVKIIFSPMNKTPNFILHENPDATFYSGYCIKYGGDYEPLLQALNSQEMADYIAVSARDYRGGWKAYNKKIVQEFVLDERFSKALKHPAT